MLRDRSAESGSNLGGLPRTNFPGTDRHNECEQAPEPDLVVDGVRSRRSAGNSFPPEHSLLFEEGDGM
jgi:hypothetical protein